MAENKTIKFRFEIDQNSFGQVKSAIDSLTSSLSKMNQAGGGMLGGGNAFGGINIGGANPGKVQTIAQGQAKNQAANGGQQMTMGKVILDNANAFKKFAQEGKDASKIMTEALKRDIGSQEQSLDRLKAKLSNLSEEFSEATRKQKEFLAAGKSSDANAMGNYIKNVEGRIAETSGQTLQSAKNLLGSKEALTSASGGMGGLKQEIGQAIKGALSGDMGSLGALASRFAPYAAAIGVYNEIREGGGGIFSGAESEVAGQGGVDLRLAARRGAISVPKYRALRSGDISSLLLEQHINENTATRKYLAQSTDMLSRGSAYTDAGKAAAITLLKSLAGASDKTAWEDLTSADIETRLMQSREAVLEKGAQSQGYAEKMETFEHFRNTLGERIATSQLMGARTLGKDKAGNVIAGGFGALQDWATKNSVGTTQAASAYAGLRQAGGTGLAGQLYKTATMAQAGGWGGFDQMAVKAGLGARSPKEAATLAMAALGGDIQTGVGIKMGDLVYGYDPRGVSSGAGLMAAVQGGMAGLNQQQQFQRAEAMPGAVKIGNAIASGALDNALLGASVLSANRIMGSNASSYDKGFLAQQTDLKLIADIGYGHLTKDPKTGKMKRVYGDLTPEMESAGVTRSMLREHFEDLTRAELGPVAQDTRSKAGRAAKAYLDSGQTFQAFAASHKDLKRDLGVAMGRGAGVSGPEAAAYGDMIASLGGSLTSGGIGAGAVTGPEKEELDRQAGVKKDLEGKLVAGHMKKPDDKDSAASIGELIKASTNMAKSYGDWGKNMDQTVTAVITALMKIPGFINERVAPGSKATAKDAGKGTALEGNAGLLYSSTPD